MGKRRYPPFWFELLFSVVVLSFGGVPIAVGFAVLRSRFYNIDLLINRTLVYGSLTATLALIFFGGVTATQALFRAVAGQEKLPQLAVVASTLVIGCAVQSSKKTYSILHRQTLLSQKVRRGQDA